MRKLSSSQSELLQEIIKKRNIRILSFLYTDNNVKISDEERERLIDAVASELVETGLRADSEPNERGVLLEELLDSLRSL